MVVEKIQTGIPGMDELLYGGIPVRNVVLVCGSPGSGKTIFAQQYIWHGLKNGEPAIYVTLEEHPKMVRDNMRNFGWDVSKYEENDQLVIVDGFTSGIGKYAEKEKFIIPDIQDLRTFIEVVRDAIHYVREKTGIYPKRAVIDSVSTLYLNKPSVARSIILQLKKLFAGYGVTTLFISQISSSEMAYGSFGPEHASDGIIRLDLDEIQGELKRSIIIWKMRGTKHDMRRHEFEITDKGIVVYPDRIVRKGFKRYEID